MYDIENREYMSW